MSGLNLPAPDHCRTILLHGLGVEGRAALPWLKKKSPAQIMLVDAEGGTLPDGKIYKGEREALDGPPPDLYLRSPGIAPTNPVAKAMSAHNVPTTTPTGYWLAFGTHGPLITLTGTKGKSTTASLVAALLKALKVKTALIGNIGAPPFSADIDKDTICVAEISSYMMHDLPLVMDFHAVTNLYREHLDWHTTMEAYGAAKLRPFLRTPPVAGLVGDMADCENDLSSLPDHFEAHVKLRDRVLEYEGQGCFDLAAINDLFRAPSMALAALASLAIIGRLTQIKTIMASPPKAATLIAIAKEVFAHFKGLPARQYVVGTFNQRLWVDDALATIPEATLSAIARFQDRPLHILIGGKDRGQDFTPFFQALPREAQICFYAFGEIAHRFIATATQAQICPAENDCAEATIYPSLIEAISAAYEKSRPGETILFSPAAPSAPKEGNYAMRSKIFSHFASQSKQSN